MSAASKQPVEAARVKARSAASFMARALSLARRGGVGVRPNPMVGCVIMSKGRVIAEGFHRRFGGAHAEALALRRAGGRAAGSTVYVNLEPCCAYPGKKTPACVDALIAAKVGRVVAAVLDPNPRVNGRSLRLLRRAGIDAEVGRLKGRAEELNRDFFTRMRLKRPYIIMKTALSLDGRSYGISGRSRWITRPASRALARRYRGQADAVLVGVETVLKDDPRLTSRGGRREPVRVVLDSRLRTPPTARVLKGRSPAWIFTSAPGALKGADTIRVSARGGLLNLRAVLRVLVARGIRILMVEGGATVHSSFLAQGLVDEVRVFLAPKLLLGCRDPQRAPRLKETRWKRIGEDFLISGWVAG